VITPVHDDSGRITHFVSSGRDITRQKRRRLLELGQSRVLEMIASDRPLPTVLARICRLMESHSQGVQASFWVLDPRDEGLRISAGPSLPDGFRRALNGIIIDPSVVSCGVGDVAESAFPGKCRDLALAHGLHAIRSEKIVADDGTLLGLAVAWLREPGERKSDDLEPFRIACSLAAIAIQHDLVEAALRKSEEDQRTLIETARDIICALSTDGIVLSLNPAFETITGWPCSEWIGKHFTGLVHPDDLPKAIESFKQALTIEQSPAVEIRIMTKSGDMVVGEFNGTPLMRVYWAA
jgi:PAS domain S-box-containing protein